MKKLLKGLATLAICGALTFGLTTDAQAAEIDFSTGLNETESQELSRHHPRYGPPPRHDHWRHGPPPPPDYWYDPPPPPRHDHWRHGPPPPPPRHGYGPPPPRRW